MAIGLLWMGNHYNYTIQYIEGAYYVGFDFEATGQYPINKWLQMDIIVIGL